MSTRRYTTVPGVFLQDDPESKEDAAVPPRFGLKDDSDDRWAKFRGEIERLNASAPPGTRYKVFFMGRHGQGYHNVAMEKYTVEACDTFTLDSLESIPWLTRFPGVVKASLIARLLQNSHLQEIRWTRETGDGVLVWGPDPELTQLGIEQARNVNRAWKAELEHGIPLPEKLYTSPMRRAMKTHQVTFEGLLKPGLKTTIVENIREKMGVSTPDKRRAKSEIADDFPDYPFEPGFAEEDESWDPEIRETADELDIRARKVLDMIFDKDEEQFISITSHHGFIAAFLRVCQHRPWFLLTGGVVPIVLRVDREQLSLN